MNSNMVKRENKTVNGKRNNDYHNLADCLICLKRTVKENYAMNTDKKKRKKISEEFNVYDQTTYRHGSGMFIV